MSFIGKFVAALAPTGAAISAAWTDLAGSVGDPTVNNEDRTITFGGGTRTITKFGSGIGVTWEYRINSGSWTAYSAGFSLTSGQTLAWRATYTTNVTTTITIYVNGVTLDQFNSEASGF